MLAKFLTIILVLFNLPVFLMGQSFSPSQNDNFSEVESYWSSWSKSLISSLWLANPNFLPIRDWGVNEPQTDAKAALIFDVNKNKLLYQKNSDWVLPIASLTKLMTALIVLENIDLEKIAVVSKEAVAAYGEQGNLVVNEEISVKNLLYALLMESSNDAAVALAQAVENKTSKNFVELMNQKAKELGLKNANFIDSTGYDPNNVATAREINQLVKYSLNYPIIWQIMKTPSIDLSSADGKINHHWVNTDKLLNRLPNIIGGKTGYTEEAQGCLVLVIEQSPDNYLISVVLGAQERFLETEKLINWVEKAYKW
jgi:D-alanyl-D-alanine carboxypeptidase